jgi:hypothetical protein
LSDISHHIKISGLIEYKLWAEGLQVKFQILWQNPKTVNTQDAETFGWSFGVGPMSLCSYDLPELMGDTICLRGVDKNRHETVSKYTLNSSEKVSGYIERVNTTFRNWAKSERFRPIVEAWSEENMQPEQLSLFE